MERDMYRGKKKEVMEPIMMDEEKMKEIMEKEGTTSSKRCYEYNINRRKTVVSKREGFESNEYEVEDLQYTKNIKEILCVKYYRKTIGHGSDAEEGTPFHI
jgi:hypothetical protein